MEVWSGRGRRIWRHAGRGVCAASVGWRARWNLGVGGESRTQRLVWLMTMCVGALLLGLVVAPSDALADLNWGTGVVAALPANAAANPVGHGR